MFEFYKFCKEDYKRSGGKISLWQKNLFFIFVHLRNVKIDF